MERSEVPNLTFYSVCLGLHAHLTHKVSVERCSVAVPVMHTDSQWLLLTPHVDQTQRPLGTNV